MPTIADFVRARAGDPHPAILFDEQSWTYAEYVQGCAERAAFLLATRRPGPFHVGVLLDNTPEFSFWLGAAALAGAVVVGINPTRRGTELARDVTHTDCQLVITEARHAPLLRELDLGVARGHVLDSETPAYAAALASHRGAVLPDVVVGEGTLFLLLFTSGTAGAPKACLCSQGRLARAGGMLAQTLGLSPADRCYQAMPLFHSNALFVGWTPCLATGATAVFRRRFSASGFLADVRRYGITYANYVGKPLSYVLATPERPDDAENTLRIAFGNEAAELDIARFGRRFGCVVIDGYGSTEGAAVISRTPDTPPGSLGRGQEGVVVLDPATGCECPAARFDAGGRLLNPDEAIGEIANRAGAPVFEGYYKNEEANAARVRGGVYWTGDLGYRDAAGFFYFAGRDFEWLRVDGENFAAAPVERILARHAPVLLAAVYAVPDAVVGDQVMAAVELRPGAAFDPADFAAFVAAQPDLGSKWAPRFVRVVAALPLGESGKPQKRLLRRERWECTDPVWWRPARPLVYRALTPEDVAALRQAFASRGRLAVLDAG
jgi:fatty-acyl-CoA synthase